MHFSWLDFIAKIAMIFHGTLGDVKFKCNQLHINKNGLKIVMACNDNHKGNKSIMRKWGCWVGQHSP
jgi:hypothetical protein